ncbi:acyl-CoA dehydrogenase [Skermanella stibiiresistens SB22]|uniref:Acyl-CoA dehydrogenase n=1 Tax=Skermanella stibiiresistens SB22 TaxID=1385369 RepID=W9H468_9PROT|nr:MaoC family dehydratase N-terminal domain-containing protein [Skermanella stibiiresistens]EWY41010.1 acyl-CoA dehydrogenase [Skermanella stibiiresistens SB22]
MDFSEWIGRSETMSDTVTAAPYAGLSATLDRPAGRPAEGTRLPALWHWLCFLPMERQSKIGPDGHPKRGGFLPPVPLPRRMWAGSQFEFHEPLRIGDAITRTSTIQDVTEKSGRTGTLVFVKVRHKISRGDTLAITEFHDIVYRDAPKPDDVAPPPKAATSPGGPPSSAWEREWRTDDVLLFRYSALTFNGHRIHYDRRYVTETEGYPGLVVHGPLIATLLLDQLRHRLPNAEVVKYEFRAVRPTFDINPFSVCGEALDDGKTFHLWAMDHEGWLTMDATAVIR